MDKDDERYIPIAMPNGNLTHCEQMGYEAEFYGANETNCNFRIFMSIAGKDAWDKGKQRAKIQKLKERNNGNGCKKDIYPIPG